MTTRHLLTCATLLFASTATVLDAGRISTADVGAVVDAPASFSQRQLRAMTAETAAIWRPYGISISWLTPLDQQKPAPDDLRVVVRLPLSPPERRDGGDPKRPLGSVLFVDGIPDGVMTIRAETVEAVIRDAGWNGRPLHEAPLGIRQEFSGRALGRVLAHELGHYLLAQKNHAPAGLMRASFKAGELVDTSRRGFRLQPRDVAMLGPRLAQLLTETRPEPGLQRPFSASVCHAESLICPACPVCVARPIVSPSFSSGVPGKTSRGALGPALRGLERAALRTR